MSQHLSDNELMSRLQYHDDEAWNVLLKRYERLIYMLIHKHMHVIKTLRLDHDDVFQEGNLGLVDAILSFEKERCMPLYPFAKVCIERRIQTYFRKYSSQAHTIFRSALSLDQSISEDEQMYLHDVVASPCFNSNPYEVFKKKELQAKIDEVLLNCTPLEQQIFKYRLEGYTYHWIAKQCGIKSKMIDNTMCKIKKALRKVI
ncbi:MAG: sigma-70 family RNA polymerase sigma factor [Erysipelotrichia bacterium]|jgi:RNA polymerase sporulation-specific sigma factor|nr:sigma-70 family RNA polymerase sigma factor [Erysipelotrichia bacterium]